MGFQHHAGRHRASSCRTAHTDTELPPAPNELLEELLFGNAAEGPSATEHRQQKWHAEVTQITPVLLHNSTEIHKHNNRNDFEDVRLTKLARTT